MSDTHGVHALAAQELPVYTMPELPETGYLLMLSQGKNLHNNTVFNGFRLPLGRVAGNGAGASHAYSLWSGGTNSIVIPSNQVVPGYVTTGVPHTITRAVGSSNVTKAKFLILGADPNDVTRNNIQASGFYKFPEGHNYTIGLTYYLHETSNGEVTTVPTNPATAQPLFYVIDQMTISIQIGL